MRTTERSADVRATKKRQAPCVAGRPEKLTYATEPRFELGGESSKERPGNNARLPRVGKREPASQDGSTSSLRKTDLPRAREEVGSALRS